MPGVPSGRGCAGCRKQKKKCDQLQPSCSRCVRVGIVCMGAGERRFKFVGDSKSARKSPSSGSSSEGQSPATTQEGVKKSLSRSPSNGSTMLVAALIEKFNGSFDLRYHLSWTYGDFLEDIPRRIGINEALDASVATLISAHSNLSSNWTVMTAPDGLAKYNHALKALRTTLNDPQKARQTETLCACYLLLICQSFLDTYAERFSSHTEGAAQILKARGYFYTNDPFEQKLLMSLRGPVLMEALLNDKIDFSREEWMDLVVIHQDSSIPEGRMIACWANMPDLIRRGKMVANGYGDRQLLIMEARQEYQMLWGLLSMFKTRYDLFQTNQTSLSGEIPPDRLYQHYQRIYGLGLSITLISNCIASAIDPANSDLKLDSLGLCDQALQLAKEAAVYRPLGAGHMPICLMAAWCSSADVQMKLALEEMLLDYLRDWPRRTSPEKVRESLEDTSRRIRLMESKEPGGWDLKSDEPL